MQCHGIKPFKVGMSRGHEKRWLLLQILEADVFRKTNHWFHISVPGLTQLRTIILQPGEKLSWGAANLVIAHMEFIFFLSMIWLLLYPLLHLDTLPHFRNLLEKLLNWARTASDLWASTENTSVCTRCLEQQRKPCGKPAWECVGNVPSSTKSLAHRYWEMNSHC